MLQKILKLELKRLVAINEEVAKFGIELKSVVKKFKILNI